MGKMNLSVKILFFFFFFLPLPIFSVSNGANGKKMENGGRGAFESRSSRIPPAKNTKSNSSSGRGTERRTSISGNGLSSSEVDDTYNPDTGWHIVTESNEILNYRGTRKVVPSESLEVSCVSAEKYWDGTTLVEICFNQEINPKSFSSSNLKINGKTANNAVKFKFSRKGDSVKIQIPAQDGKFSLSIDDVEAFDGERIPEIKLNDISVN